MNVAVTIHDVEGVSVARLSGRIILGEESSALREAVQSLMAAGKKKVVLDMSDVTYIDSAGLGILVGCYVSAGKQGAIVRLCSLGNKFREVLQLTRLLTIFDVYDTLPAAIGSFREGALTTSAAGKP
jgi:anti-sigma B factor antagonist